MKSRVGDWACICRIIPSGVGDHTVSNKLNMPESFDITVYYNKLFQCLVSGNHPLALGYAEGFITQSLHDATDAKRIRNQNKNLQVHQRLPIPEALSKVLFEQLSHGANIRGQKVKYYTNKRQVIWACLLTAAHGLNNQNMTNLKYPNVLEIVE